MCHSIMTIFRGRMIWLLASFVGCVVLHAREPAPVVVQPIWDGSTWDNAPTDGKGNAAYAGSPTNDEAGVGELDDSAAKRMERALYCFALPLVPGDQVIRKATLRLYLSKIRNEGGRLPDAHVYHNQKSTITTGYMTYYENSDFTDTGISAATSSSKPGWVELDVTKQVADDYAHDLGMQPISWFRIQVDGLTFSDDNKSNRYLFKLSKGKYKPELIITTAGGQARAAAPGLPVMDKAPRHGLFALTNTGNWVIEGGKRLDLFDYDVSGVTNYVTWRDVEPAPGMMRYPGFDAMMQDAARTGKKLAYNILSGMHTPQWVYDKGIEKFSLNDRKREVSSFLPWKEVDGRRVLNTDMLAIWEEVVRAYSDHLYKNPNRDRVFYVAITGFPFGNGLELMVGIDNYADFSRLHWDAEAENLYIEYCKRVVDMFITYFPDVPLGLAFADYYGTNSDGSPRRSYHENDEIVSYALARAKLKGVTVVPMGLWLGWDGIMNETHPLIRQMRKFQKEALAVAMEGQMGSYKFKNCIPLSDQLSFAHNFPVAWVQLWHYDIIHPEYQPVLAAYRPQFEE